MSKYDELLTLLQGSQKDFESFFEKGNKAAGTRVRKAMFELIGSATDVRKEVSKIKNA